MKVDRARHAGLLAMLTLLWAACAGGEAAGPGEGRRDLSVQVASYDLAVGTTRFTVGLLTGGNELVAGGTVDMEFTAPEGADGFAATGTFLPLPEETEAHEEGGPPHATGVYAADVTFNAAGPWEVEVTASVDGRPASGTARFEVKQQPRFPAPGELAPRSDNLTLDSRGVPDEAIDSRAGEGDIPDPELHRTTVAAAVRAGRPAVVVISTPVFCETRFCGPVTDMVAGLAADYPDAARYIHIEVWKDRQGNVVNRAAADWALRGDTLLEPWVYLIGEDGRIMARWDNVATRPEIEPLLARLPD